MRSPSPTRSLPVLIGTAILSLTLACGTLLYPERRGREDGRVDPAVVVMDGALLFVFIVPGVVAFGVDLATGAIYESEGADWARRPSGSELALSLQQADELRLRLPKTASTLEPGAAVWWESARGERIDATLSPGGDPDGLRMSSEGALRPGRYQLVLADGQGVTRRIPITLL